MLVLENVYNKIQSLFSADSIVDCVSYVMIYSIVEIIGYIITWKAVEFTCAFPS